MLRIIEMSAINLLKNMNNGMNLSNTSEAMKFILDYLGDNYYFNLNNDTSYEGFLEAVRKMELSTPVENMKFFFRHNEEKIFLTRSSNLRGLDDFVKIYSDII